MWLAPTIIHIDIELRKTVLFLNLFLVFVSRVHSVDDLGGGTRFVSNAYKGLSYSR